MKIYINGRFLGRPTTGVERFGQMILASIDRSMSAFPAAEFTVFVPNSLNITAEYKNIKFRHCGFLDGHLWEQIELPWFSRDGKLLNLCNSGPLAHRDQLTVIHDALVYRMPRNFSFSYRKLHQFLGHQLARCSRIATVSDFSRRELSSVLAMSVDDIVRVWNGSDHYANVVPDRSIVNRLELEGAKYFIFVGSPARNKNLETLIAAFEKLCREDVYLVAVGGLAKTFSTGSKLAGSTNLVQTGRVSDEELHALYAEAVALVFPSTYEGFGIPLLEAMFVGCPVLSSSIPVAHEVCGDAATFFKPLDVEDITSALSAALDPKFDRLQAIERGRKRATEFSWSKSAEILINALIK